MPGDETTQTTETIETPADAGSEANDEGADAASAAAEADKGATADANAEGSSDAGEKDGEKDEKQGDAPEKYEDFKMPEGVENVDTELMGKFTEFAKANNLSQDNAQQLVTMYAENMQKAATAAADAASKAWSDVTTEWETAVKADPELGGDNLEANLAIGLQAIKQFGDKDGKLQEALDLTGAGSHPEVIRFFYKVGKAIANDDLHLGATRDGGPKTQAERLFPTMSEQAS